MEAAAILDVVYQRLHTQHLTDTPLEKPEDVVEWLGAVQSQDYAGARWSLALRVRDCTKRQVDEAFSSGRILRTHVMRPTWHFVTPADIRWILELTAPRVHALNAYMYRKLELDEADFARGHTLFRRALQGGKQLTRVELAALLKQAGISANGLRLAYIVMQAELEGLICSGALRGKQHTYALLEERAPKARRLTREEALAELARRFFVSHGPATLGEYVRWSGLSVADAKAGLEMVKQALVHEVWDGQSYWFSASMSPVKQASRMVYLLPEYDECVLTYTELTFPDMPRAESIGSWNDTFYRPIIVEGKRAGTWRRTIAKEGIVLEANLFTPLDASQWQALETAAERYGMFMGMPVRVTMYP